VNRKSGRRGKIFDSEYILITSYPTPTPTPTTTKLFPQKIGLIYLSIYEMKSKAEILEIIRKWWAHNQTLAQPPEGRYFIHQIRDWESGFKNYGNENWIPPTDWGFQIVSVKSIKEGLSIHLKGSVDVEGILDTKGNWNDRGDSIAPFRGASLG